MHTQPMRWSTRTSQASASSSTRHGPHGQRLPRPPPPQRFHPVAIHHLVSWSPLHLVNLSPGLHVTLSLNVSLQVVARYPWKRLKHLDLNGRLSCRVLQVDSTIEDQRANHYVSRLLWQTRMPWRAWRWPTGRMRWWPEGWPSTTPGCPPSSRPTQCQTSGEYGHGGVHADVLITLYNLHLSDDQGVHVANGQRPLRWGGLSHQDLAGRAAQPRRPQLSAPREGGRRVDQGGQARTQRLLITWMLFRCQTGK